MRPCLRRVKAHLFAVVVGVVTIAGLSSSAAAQDIAYQRKTKIEFTDGDLIDGNLAQAEGTIVDVLIKRPALSLIKVRAGFRAEVLESVGGL